MGTVAALAHDSTRRSSPREYTCPTGPKGWSALLFAEIEFAAGAVAAWRGLVDTGTRLSKVSVPDGGYPLEHAIMPSRKILMRTADGGIVLLHVSPDGQPTTEHLGRSFAAIFASAGRLVAIRDGVFCELREPA